jgi:hypothetical protein
MLPNEWLALVDGDYPATIDLGKTRFRTGLATTPWREVGLQEICRMGQFERSPMSNPVIKATMMLSVAATSTFTVFAFSWIGFALLGF